MTIQGALLSALSSMAAEQAQAQLIANNIANASNPGYVRRVLPRSESVTGGVGQGVALGVTQRAGDALLEASSRSAIADQGYGNRMTTSLKAFTQIVGQPSDAQSLSSMLGSFQTAMTTLSSTPADAVTQTQAVAAAQDLADSFHALDKSVSKERVNADLAVKQDVDAVNTLLERLTKVERDFTRASVRGDSTAEYEDQRALILSDLSAIVPVRTFGTGPGNLIVKSDKGTTLFDGGQAHKLVFTHTATIASTGTGGLSSVTTEDGQTLAVSQTGSLAASLELRDTVLPEYGQMLDEIAGNLVKAFRDHDETVQASPIPSEVGLFANGSSLSDITTTNGLARTIAVNSRVTSAAWRIRDGVNAAVEGNASNNSIILAQLDAMDKTPASANYTVSRLPSSMNLSNAVSQSIGLMQSDNNSWINRAGTRTTLATQAGKNLADKTGVNVDEELQRLLLVQQTYAASAQVIQTAAKMLDTLNTLNS